MFFEMLHLKRVHRYLNKTHIVDHDNGIAYIEAGLQWIDIYPKLAPFIPVAGTCPYVGVMGFTLGGGYSMLSRSYGLASDNVIEFQMVDASGRLLTINQNTYPDLFWALRGIGGGNLGVVLSVKTKIFKSPPIFTAGMCWDFDNAPTVMEFYNKWTLAIPKEMAAYGLFYYNPHDERDEFCLTFVYNGDYSTGYQYFKPFQSLAKGKISFLENQPFFKFMEGFASGTTDIKHRLGIVKSGMIRKGNMNDKVSSTIHKFMSDRPSKLSMLIWSHVGGRISEINVEESSFYRRNVEFVFEMKAIYEDSKDHDINMKWIQSFYSEMRPHFDGAYLNYIDPQLSDWKEMYYGSHYQRLEQIKTKYDPNNFFKFKQSVGVLSSHQNGNLLSQRDDEILKRVKLFQFGQVRRDVTILEPLFAENSIANIPIGSSQTRGKSNIIRNFGTFFLTLNSLSEEITSKIEINELYAGFTKTITQQTKKGCNVHYSVLNWFVFDTNLQIIEFSALFNLTSVIIQSNC